MFLFLFRSVRLFRGFSRETRTLKKVYGLEIPPNAVAFRHPKFMKDRPELAVGIRQSTGRELKMAGKAKSATPRRDSSSTMSSNRSSSPSSCQIGSPVVVPTMVAAPSLELTNPASISEAPAISQRVASTSLSATLQAPAVAASEVEEGKQSSLRGRDGSRLASPFIMADRSAYFMEYYQSQQQEVQSHEVILQRLEEERLRREQDEMLVLLLNNQQRRQQHIQDLTQEVTLRRQLLASALSGTTASYTTAQSSLPVFGTTPSPASAQDEALLRLQYLLRLQQERD
jgi:hypothetical protein